MDRGSMMKRMIQAGKTKEVSLTMLNEFIESIQPPRPPNNAFCRELYAWFIMNSKDKTKYSELKTILQNLNYEKHIKKTKNSLCGGILKKGEKVYKCHNCITQDNSILCANCFDQSKHIGHKFQRIAVFGGCCDCGDVQKWKEQGFCQQHKVQEQINITIDEQLQDKFLVQQQYAFTYLLQMYDKYVKIRKHIKENNLSSQIQSLKNLSKQSQNKIKEQSIKKIVEYIEIYASIYFAQLLQFNTGGQYAHHMIYTFLKSTLSVKFNYLQVFQYSPTVLNLLFTFKYLHQTLNQICEICISMFSFHNFKEELLVLYIKLYTQDPSFIMTGYNQLSSQLLTSHIIIYNALKKQSITPLLYRPIIEQPEYNIQTVSQNFVKFLVDIRYLLKLYGQTSVQYFQIMAKRSEISSIGYYREVLNDYPKSAQYYGLENIYIDKISYLVRLISKDKSNIIFHHTLKDLYRFITTFKTKRSNLYRPQQRLFTMIIFSSINCQLQALNNDQNILNLLKIFQPKDLKQQLQILITNAFNIIALLSQKMQNMNDQLYYTWIHYYLKKKDIIIFSLDAIYIKILLKIADYHNKHAIQQQQKIDYNKIIHNSLSSQHKIMNFNSSLRKLQPMMTTLNNLNLDPKDLSYLNNYLHLVYQILESDLHELKVACYYVKNQLAQESILKDIYQDQIMHYYVNLIKVNKNQRVFIKDFKEQCQYFFNEEIIFKKFITLYVDKSDNKKLLSQNNDGIEINSSYFISLAKQFNNITYAGPLNNIAYYKKTKLSTYFIENITIFNHAFEYMQSLSQKLYNQQNAQIVELIIRNNYKKYMTLGCMLYCHQKPLLIQLQLKKYFQLAMSQDQKNLLRKYLMQNENLLIKQIKGYIFHSKSQEMMQDENEKQMQKQRLKDQQRKLKLQLKKKIMMNKINKDKESYLLEKNQQTQKQEQVCYLCKENNCNEILYYNAFVTLTNFNLWLNLGQNTFSFFNTCGHMVHRNCYKKSISKNQVYNFCILCKKPVNILISSSLSQNIKNEETQMNFWRQFQSIRTVLQEKYNQIMQVKAMITSIVIMTVLKSTVCSAYYNKSFGLLKLIIPFIKAQYKKCPQKFEQCIFKINYNTQDNHQIRLLFSYVQSLLMKQLGITISMQQQCNCQQISQTFKQNINQILHFLVSEDNTQLNHLSINFEESQQRKILLSALNNPQIFSNLSQLTCKYLKKCNNCLIITQSQAVCLICKSYSTCIGCSAEGLMAHSLKCHLGVCSFLSTDTGQITYIYQGRSWKFESIYQDYIGRSYQQNSQQDKSQFILNKNKLSQHLDDIKNFNIQSRLRYNEKVIGKVNHSVIL